MGIAILRLVLFAVFAVLVYDASAKPRFLGIDYGGGGGFGGGFGGGSSGGGGSGGGGGGGGGGTDEKCRTFWLGGGCVGGGGSDGGGGDGQKGEISEESSSGSSESSDNSSSISESSGGNGSSESSDNSNMISESSGGNGSSESSGGSGISESSGSSGSSESSDNSNMISESSSGIGSSEGSGESSGGSGESSGSSGSGESSGDSGSGESSGDSGSGESSGGSGSGESSKESGGTGDGGCHCNCQGGSEKQVMNKDCDSKSSTITKRAIKSLKFPDMGESSIPSPLWQSSGRDGQHGYYYDYWSGNHGASGGSEGVIHKPPQDHEIITFIPWILNTFTRSATLTQARLGQVQRYIPIYSTTDSNPSLRSKRDVSVMIRENESDETPKEPVAVDEVSEDTDRSSDEIMEEDSSPDDEQEQALQEQATDQEMVDILMVFSGSPPNVA